MKRLQDWQARMQPGQSLFQSQARWGCWLDAHKRNEPPGDSAGRFAGRFDGN